MQSRSRQVARSPLSPFQYSLDAPSMELTKQEINKLIRQDLTQNDTRRTWTEPVQCLGKKTAFYKENFLRLTEDGFIVRPEYMDTHLSFGIRCAIGQIRTSSHQLEVETGRYSGIPPEKRICRICHYEPETEEHHICRCTAFYEIRGRFHCLFKEGFGPLSKVMEYCDQRCLGLFLVEIKKYREDFLKKGENNKPGVSQRCMSDFFERTNSFHTEGRRKIPTKGVRIERAVQLGRMRRPKKPTTSLHRKKVYKYIKGILDRHRDRTIRFLSGEEVEHIRHRPMREFLR